ncbi:MAG: DNA-directed RNA polymerase subunit alpha [Candidatus Andersenbacteria bacterium]|nr:DNA-directed RNA polymerase subunit alpha [Candidatus Andersenbacteria bacterium]MBI3250322.1 DNA-directed RNA polymerase subunit alpha [Candidatus Andersenbacteria bacterium]
MLEPIYLPDSVTAEEEGKNTARFTIQPYYPGYGPTVGNALRRVLLSSLPGAAVTQMRIAGADHEFSTIEGVKEDLLNIMLNIKGIRVSSEVDEPVEIRLTVSGEKKAKAGDFKTPPKVTISNVNHHIATLTDKKASLDIICTVERGRGYVPSEAQASKERPIGTIALDAAFTPVERVSYTLENVRVGQETDYHALKMIITTDGTITPEQALRQAASILKDHFAELTGDFATKLTAERVAEVPVEETPEETPIPKNTLNLLQLPSRVHNALERVGITTVEQVLDLTDEQIRDIPGLGVKAVEDLTGAREDYIKRQNKTTEETSNEA